ncbi:GNAT family N-acetyltransferase [Arthrobacter sp. NPDC080073]|uniref:GNAT family N-acetyltransferase n=1 Tax=Arthrobacter sp. NPDC080073 TaxID=3155919 RepID=UPI00343CB083
MQIRECALDDLAQVNAVCDAAGRNRWTRDMIAPRSDRFILVAVAQGEVIGVAKTHFHSNPADSSPAGHYLGGVVVAPEFRRRGVGSALTQARLEWIWSRASSAHYFANEHNTASIRMHEALGFRPVARFSEIRGVTADDGRSKLILFEAHHIPGQAAESSNGATNGGRQPVIGPAGGRT